MLQSKAKWNYSEPIDITTGLDELSEISPIIKKMLLQRGITTKEEANQFLSPDLHQLHSPEQLSSITKATERVHQAISNKEKILVFGDYDADGVSSTTVMLKTLLELGADCDYYIPNRFSEGYGPNEEAFIEAYKSGFTLIITVDTGIAAVHEAAVAKELNIDLIITDHHEVQDELPDAFAILHPKCSPEYPFKELAGVGVAFKFAEALLGYFPKHLLEFVAIGTIADLVPLVDENRVLTFYGLHALTISKNLGIKALKNVCKMNGNITEEDVGFSIGPRLNAVGRLQDADLAVQLLMSDDLYEATELAEEIEAINEQRKEIVNNIVKEAEQIVSEVEGVIVVAKEGWNEGVLGIVASKLVRKYDRPAIVLTIKPETGEAKGSARSIPAFDLFQNCMKVRELFTHFGGHAQAAGMTLPVENINCINEKLNEFIYKELSEDDFKQEIEITDTLNLSDISIELIKEISRLSPFGMKNPKPLFQIVEIPDNVRQIGSSKNHLKLQFKKEKTQVEGIGFGQGDLYHFISPMTPLTVVGELSINEWNGMKKPQIMIRDMRIDSWQLFDNRGRRHTEVDPYLHLDLLALTKEEKPLRSDLKQITYDTDQQFISKTDILFIFDLPDKLEQLEEIIQRAKPKIIQACYTVEDSAYLTSFPSRENFVWFYALIKKRKELDLKRELTAIMNAKGWSKEQIVFISKVFFELGFVKIDNGVIQINPNPNKRDLSDSKLYQERLNRIQMEKTLYYSNYEELRNWFSSYISDLQTAKEEIKEWI
ncbi:single-stranded-DNA-specific exonuclease RecJ [Oceanobacillus halophilus]|uniref:Single-stranded-DNA-specific exonuclease RecJ n=1 Tax=Oceanobacillus halophilus TaxID=930130 RepID=A0A495AD34_9BACI|nr:single-stranded-DNA-specific exonuclease RecJ [Oceanobacillus halophilus]RKQ37887.1 single-stranded-DNA-specific exonuclease RecJ [Oceanobacillus halophilus]